MPPRYIIDSARMGPWREKLAQVSRRRRSTADLAGASHALVVPVVTQIADGYAIPGRPRGLLGVDSVRREGEGELGPPPGLVGVCTTGSCGSVSMDCIMKQHAMSRRVLSSSFGFGVSCRLSRHSCQSIKCADAVGLAHPYRSKFS